MFLLVKQNHHYFKLMIKYFVFLIFLYFVKSAPINKPEPQPSKDDWLNELHYKEYLKEISREIESDKNFVAHLNGSTNITHIALGIEKIHHSIRSKLDEIKRAEIDRINKLEKLIHNLNMSGTRPSLEQLKLIDKKHVDFTNEHTFGVEDLRKLIYNVHRDLKVNDKAQDEEFKRYEMEKEHERQKLLNHTKDLDERKRLEKEYEDSLKRHNEHPKLHHPGSEEQLKEVWKDEDNMDPDQFNSKTLFNLHDLNGDMYWDEAEIEALMQHELNKAYAANNSDDDMQERFHEMMRMRQDFMQGADKDQDGRISFAEFIDWTNGRDYKDDPEWKTQEEEGKPPYSDEEFKEFERTHPADDDYDIHPPTQPHATTTPFVHHDPNVAPHAP